MRDGKKEYKICKQATVDNIKEYQEVKEMKRQGLIVTTGQLYRLIEDIEEEHTVWEGQVGFLSEERKIQINKTPKCSDTWEIE